MNATSNSDSGRFSQRGFTLVELMVAVVIIAISVLALYEMFIQGNEWITEEIHRRTAFEKAQGHLEELGVFRTICDTVPRNRAGTFEEYLIPPGEDVESITAIYKTEISHSDVIRQNGLAYWSYVKITYSWIEYSGRAVQLELQNYY